MISRFASHMLAPAILILVGAVLAAVGGFWAAYRQQRATTQAALERAQFEKELRTKSEEIAELNRTIAGSVTGGDSFCYLDLIPAGAKSMLLLINDGRFPLYDISVRVVDVKKLNAAAKVLPPSEALWRSQVVISGGNLGSKQTSLVGEWPDPTADSEDLNIFVSARNGFVTELFRRRRVGGEWQRAIRVTRDVDNTVLFEKIDPKYPRDESGQVVWGS